MNRKIVQVHQMDEYSEIKENLKYWLSRPPDERVAAVDALRQEVYGDSAGLQRVARVIQRPQG